MANARNCRARLGSAVSRATFTAEARSAVAPTLRLQAIPNTRKYRAGCRVVARGRWAGALSDDVSGFALLPLGQVAHPVVYEYWSAAKSSRAPVVVAERSAAPVAAAAVPSLRGKKKKSILWCRNDDSTRKKGSLLLSNVGRARGWLRSRMRSAAEVCKGRPLFCQWTVYSRNGRRRSHRGANRG